MGQNKINIVLPAKAKQAERRDQRRKFHLPFFKPQKNHFIGRYPAYSRSIETAFQNDYDLAELIAVKRLQVLIAGSEQAMVIVPHLQQSFFGHIGVPALQIAAYCESKTT